MNFNFSNNIEYCKDIVSGLSNLLYYSHIPVAVIALLTGFFIFWQTKKSLLSKIFLFITSSFFIWSFLDLIIWTRFYQSSLLMASWAPIEIFSVLIFLSSLYFVYVFLNKKDVSLKIKWAWLILILPLIMLSPTIHNLESFDLQECVALENSYYIKYVFFLKILFSLWIIILSLMGYIKSKSELRKQIVLLSTGLLSFIFSFFIAGLISEKTGNYQFEIYGLFGMVVFISFLAYLIVRFKVFNLKVFGAQVLVTALIVLIGSQFAFIQNPTNKILNSVTFVLSFVFGVLLIKNVKNEIEQRERSERLSEDLELANEKLKSLDKLKNEFLSLAAHQSRSPLTAIKGYTSMLLEGDFGSVNEAQKGAIDRVFESSNHLVKVVEDLLNVSKIEQGGMQYVMNPFDFEKISSDIASDLRVTAEKKGLTLTFQTDGKSPYTVNGDMEKIRQVILNLIDNSIKYTASGSINVMLSKDQTTNKIRLAVKDTGMGMTPETKATLFQKFNRGEGGKMNASGSGLGLYLAKQISEAHHGSVWVESDGVGLGSTFIIELGGVK